MSPGLIWKTRLMAIFVVLSSAFGNLLLTVGMREAPEVTLDILSLLKPIFNPWVAAGIILLISWMLARMTFLSWADLSYVLPVTAIGYVVSALLGMIFLSEQINGPRWAGVALIVAGTTLVGLGKPHLEGSAKDSDEGGGKPASGGVQ